MSAKCIIDNYFSAWWYEVVFRYIVKPRYKVPQYNGHLDIKEIFVSWIKDVVWLSKMPLFLS